MNAALDFLAANWLGLLTLAVVAFGAVTSWRHFRRSGRDVTPKVFLLDEERGRRNEVTVEHRGDSSSPSTVDLVVVNVGGSKLKRGKLTLTLSHGLHRPSTRRVGRRTRRTRLFGTPPPSLTGSPRSAGTTGSDCPR